MKRVSRLSTFFFLIASSFSLFALESTQVLPKGIRSLGVKQLHTSVTEKYNASTQRESIAKPLSKPLKISDILKKEEGLNRMLREALVLSNEGLTFDTELGSFKANMAAKVRVTVPLLSYGLTENLTVALALPIFEASSAVKADFNTNENADAFVRYIKSPDIAKRKEAEEARLKLNDAVGSLNEKLVSNGYRELKDWTGTGVGDLVAALKYRFLNRSIFKGSGTLGGIFPTGRISDPDILNDVPFGSGVTSIFTTLASDQTVASWLFFNEYVKGTFNLPGKGYIRLKTAEEAIEVPKEYVSFQLGHKIEIGASAQVSTSFGLVGGFGYVYERKLGDSYTLPNNLTAKEELEKDTASFTNYIMAKLGYSSIPAFKKKQLPLPLIAGVEYKKQLLSQNASVKDFLTFDLTLFF